MLDKTILTLEDLVKDEGRAETVKNGAVYNSGIEGVAWVVAHMQAARGEYELAERAIWDMWELVCDDMPVGRHDTNKARISFMRAAHECIAAAAALDKLKHSAEVWKEIERGEHEV